MTEKKTISETIWEDIKNRPIDLFSIPNKKVSDYCERKNIEPTKVYLIPKTASSFLAALEKAIGSKYVLEQMLGYIVVSLTPTIHNQGENNAI